MAKKYLGVDLGGTKIEAGIVENDQLIFSKKKYLNTTSDKERLLDEIFQFITSLLDEDICGIGIGVPGLVNPENGRISHLENIPALEKVSLKEMLVEKFGLPVAINNDANCFALGVKYFGPGKPYKNLVGITIGTGLGMGIIANNQLLVGKDGGAGEIGALPYQSGIFEDYCSGKFFQHSEGKPGEILFEEAIQGNSHALEVFNVFGQYIGEAIKIILHMLNPEAIFLGGSVAKTYHLFKNSMWNKLKNIPMTALAANLSIEPAVNKNYAVLGAAALNRLSGELEYKYIVENNNN